MLKFIHTGCVSESGRFCNTVFFWFGNTVADVATAILLPALKRFSCNGAVDWSTRCFCCEGVLQKRWQFCDRSAWISKRVWDSLQSCCSISACHQDLVSKLRGYWFYTKEEGGSVKTVRTRENIAVERERPLKEVHTVLRVASLCHSGCLKSQVFKSSSTPHSSGVETLNSARSHRNSCGDATKSNWWRSQETYRVPRAEWRSSEWCYFQKVGLLFLMC